MVVDSDEEMEFDISNETAKSPKKEPHPSNYLGKSLAIELPNLNWIDAKIAKLLQEYFARPSEESFQKAWLKYLEGKDEDRKVETVVANMPSPGRQHLKVVIFAKPTLSFAVYKVLQCLEPTLTEEEYSNIRDCFYDRGKYIGVVRSSSRIISYSVYLRHVEVQNICRNELHETSADSVDCIIYLAGDKESPPYPIMDWFFPNHRKAQTALGADRNDEALPILLIFKRGRFDWKKKAPKRLSEMVNFFMNVPLGSPQVFRLDLPLMRVYNVHKFDRGGLNINEAMTWAMNKIQALRAS